VVENNGGLRREHLCEREEGNAHSPPDIHYTKEPTKGKRLQVNRQSSSILSVKAKGRGTAGAKSPRSAEGETGKSELSPGAWTFIVPLYAWFDKVFVITGGCFWAQGCSVTTTVSPESLQRSRQFGLAYASKCLECQVPKAHDSGAPR